MFPPKPTKSIDEMINNLCASLGRAGDHIGPDRIIRQEEGGYRVFLKLQDALPKGAKKPVSAYIRLYAKACGWRARPSIRKGYLEIWSSKA